MSDNTRMGQLYALADLYNVSCDKRVTRYQECKAKFKDPSACLAENHAIDQCFAKLKKMTQEHCPDKFNETSKCYDLHTYVLVPNKDPCRKPQQELNDCAKPLVSEILKEEK